MKNKAPAKPKSMEEQIDQLWDAVFNDISHRLDWQDKKLNFILAFIGLVMILVSVTLVVVLT